MYKPVVSVVMVACNVDRFLAESIESILGQTFCDFEFIIVDYGSTDNSKSIISSYALEDCRVKFHEIPHCGLAEARNAGCFLSQGRYIAIMDADDVSLPERLTWEVEFMEKHVEVGFIGGAVEWIDATGARLANPMPPHMLQYGHPPVEDSELREALVQYCPFFQPTVLIRSEAFALIGGYRANFAQAEDYDLWLRISEHFQIANLKQVVAQIRIHSYQSSVRKRKEQTLYNLAARAAAASRKNGNPDPLNLVEEVTPELLTGLGVSEAAQQYALATEYQGWIHSMSNAGDCSGALVAAIEMLRSSDWKFVDRRVIADMRLMTARLYWKNNRIVRSIITAGLAVMARPMVVGRPLKPILRRLGLV